MKIVITSATQNESLPLQQKINALYKTKKSNHHFIFHESGVGILASAVSLLKLVLAEKPDLVIQIGIAGSFHTSFKPGKVVAVKNDFLGNTGVEENNVWKDIFDMKLAKANKKPFTQKGLLNTKVEELNLLNLPIVNAITVSEVTTTETRINQLKTKYNAAIEGMEGAALHYVCLDTRTTFLQLRAISNYVGERNKQNWEIKKAIDNVNAIAYKLINKISQQNK